MSIRAIAVLLLVAAISSGCPNTDPGDGGTGCVNLIPLRQWTADPSAVALLYRAENCADGASVILDPESSGKTFSEMYQLTENGEQLSSEAVPRVTRSSGQRTYVTLLLDFSSSTHPVKMELVEAAKLFSQRLLSSSENIYVSIRIFDGRASPHTVVLPTREISELQDGLTKLGTAPSSHPILGPQPDMSSTDLYGAFVNGVTDAQEHQSLVMSQNADGIVTSGYIAVFTDGRDTSNRLSVAQAQQAVNDARTYQGGDPVVGTFAVALKGADYTAEARTALLQVVGDEQYLVEGELAELNQRFSDLADRIGDRARSTHLLVYCSPARAGERQMRLTVAPEATGNAEGSTGLTFEFSAATFSGGCIDFLQTVCADKECAGFNCGACNDATEKCVPSTGQCVDECVLTNQCSGESLTNALGYSRSCGAGVDVAKCGGQCTDIREDESNCGACGVTCNAAAGEACVDGACSCPGGGTVCVPPENQAHRAFLGLDVAIEKSLELSFAGFNAADSAIIPPQSTTGDVAGTLTITGQVDQGASDSKGMRLRVGMVGYSDGDIVVKEGGAEQETIQITYATPGDTAAQPTLSVQLQNIPNGTLTGTLIGDFAMTGDVEDTLTLNLSFTGEIEDDGSGGTRRKMGTTAVTGTATAGGGGVYQVDLKI